jgi:hypothetical protein
LNDEDDGIDVGDDVNVVIAMVKFYIEDESQLSEMAHHQGLSCFAS